MRGEIYDLGGEIYDLGGEIYDLGGEIYERYVERFTVAFTSDC